MSLSEGTILAPPVPAYISSHCKQFSVLLQANLSDEKHMLSEP